MGRIEERRVVLREGAAVTLRSPGEDDAQVLLDYVDVVRRETDGIMFSPLDRLPTLEEERTWIRGFCEGPGSLQVGAWDGDELIGSAGVRHSTRPVRQSHCASLGISLRSPWCGRGLGGEMMHVLIDWSRMNETIKLLQLSVFAHNTRAIRLYERLGFTQEGIQRRGVRYEDGRYTDVVHMGLWLGGGDAVDSC